MRRMFVRRNAAKVVPPVATSSNACAAASCQGLSSAHVPVTSVPPSRSSNVYRHDAMRAGTRRSAPPIASGTEMTRPLRPLDWRRAWPSRPTATGRK